MKRTSTILTILTITLLTASCFVSAAPAAGPVAIRLEVQGRTLEGSPLTFNKSNVTLLTRDGYLRQLAANKITDFAKAPSEFRPYDYSEMRGALMDEFGRGFEVSGTGHYIVVHPAGQRDVWANRFEELYRSFQHYFSQRGFEMKEPQFPLVAVVFGSRADFDRYATRDGQQLGPGVLGYYSVESNRVAMFDIDDGNPATEWGADQNAATIIHEATHQTAFNTGIHNRFGTTPRWLGEGLGTMFEAPGVWNSRVHMNLEDRINKGRLHSFRKYQQRRRAGALAEMIASDRAFKVEPDGAYAEAWATTLYLTEQEPTRFARYVALVSTRPNFLPYDEQQRLRDFQTVFGEDLRMMEVRITRYLAKLP